MLQKTLQFLLDSSVFYLATADDGLPRVRPFGLVLEYDGKLWFGTANTKPVYRQLQANPHVEISTALPSAEWIRLNGKAVFENNAAVKQKAFEIMPTLKSIYAGPDDPVFEVFFLAEAEVSFWSMGDYTRKPETYRL